MRSMLLGNLFTNWFDKIVDFIVGFFAVIPQFMYFLYASIASLLDLLQSLVRTLAGLDVYYVNGEPQKGDILLSFLRGILGIDKTPAYSALSTVFWSIVIFGVILLVLTTIIAIIKAHYNYDANKSHPLKILGGSIKSVATMIIVPIVAIFGVYLSQILLGTLDTITSASSPAQVSEVFEPNAFKKFEHGEDAYGNITYASYDYFSAGEYSNTPTFSGMMFKVAAYSCNRVRSTDYRINTAEGGNNAWDNAGVFFVKNDSTNPKERLAEQIDFAFANNLKLKEEHKVGSIKIEDMDDAGDLWSSLRFGYSATLNAGLYNVKSFSKYNVGLVWYYYNLWSFNWILGFAGIIISISMFGNIIFGLMARLLQLVALFLVFPALIGIMPLDEGNSFVNWRKQFMADILMAFGAIVGLNIFFLILPFFQSISFFNNSFLDGIMNMIIVIAGLTLVKKFIGLTSKFVGGSDANETGQATRNDVTSSAIKGVVGTLGAASLGLAIPGVKAAKVGLKAAGKGATKVANKFKNSKIAGKVNTMRDNRENKKINEKLGRDKNHTVTAEERAAFANLQKLDKKERKLILKEIKPDVKEAKKYRKKGGEIYNNAANTLSNQASAALLKHMSGEELTKHTNASKDRRQEKVDKRYKRAQNVASLMGVDPDKIEKGVVNEDGTVESKGSSVFKGIGQAAVDFSEAAVKTVSSLAGLSTAWKKLDEAGAVDAGRTVLKRAAANFAPDTLVNAKSFQKVTTTSGEKKGKDKKDLEKMRQSQLDAIKASATQSEQVKDAIERLISEVKKK